ncbi:MAG TPA: hypothetical protein VGR00_00585, partial [Thermoanaerobaculia bacterium]|nr:hypothetical protein [Thermoanaerobaculia bacterium]
MNLTRLPALGALAGVLLAASPAASAASHIASTASARELLAGEAKGTSVTADGRLTLGEPLEMRAWPEDASDAVVFAAASDSAGNVYVATGGGLGRLFVSRPDGKVSLLFTAAEPNLTAVVVAPDGGVVCGSSPNGKIYRVDPKEKSPESAGRVLGDPKEAAIWALVFGPDGALYAGTGNKGRIYRRRGKDGSLDLFREIEDVHVRSLAVGGDGTVYAGTSDRGLLVAIAPDGSSLRTIHDFARPEVVGIVVKKDGTILAAASSAEGAPGAGASLDVKRAPSPVATPAPKEGDETPKGTVSVSTGPVRFAPTSAASREGSGEVVQIGADGFVEPAWIFPDETIFSIRFEERTNALVVTTGSKGRVYRWKDRHVTLE